MSDITDLELIETKLKQTVYNLSSRSEKTAWERKYANLKALLDQLEPIEEKISELQFEQMKLFDQIQELRKPMVEACVHPMEMQVVKDGKVICKFCETTITLADANNG